MYSWARRPSKHVSSGLRISGPRPPPCRRPLPAAARLPPHAAPHGRLLLPNTDASNECWFYRLVLVMLLYILFDASR